MANTTLKPDDKGVRLDSIYTNNYPVQPRLHGIEPYPVGFIEAENNIIDIEAERAQKYHGLLLDTHVVKDAESKARAAQSLYGWKYVELTAREWIAHLCAGHIIQPSSFRPTDAGKWTHAKEFWLHTYFVFADADNIRGIEFLSDGTDKNPNGVAPFTTHAGLDQFPTLKFKVYAITESVSSMHKVPLHRRYRLAFLFDDPITSEAHYHQVLLALAREFPIIPSVERSPAQPVFGNARTGHNHAAIAGNFLRVSDYPYQEPEPQDNDAQDHRNSQEHATDDELYRILTENNIPFEPRPRGGFFVRCPHSQQHTDGRCGRTDAYVFIGDTGACAFHCSHASCQSTGKSTWAAFKEGYNIKSDRTYTAKQRLYVKTDAQHIKTDVMDTIRILLQDDVLEWLLKVYDAEKPQLLIVNTGTATGKSHVVTALLENLIMLTPTIELSEEAYQKALELGKNAVLHYSRWYHWSKYREYLENPNLNRADIKMSLKDPDGVSCREPDKCEALFQKGHSARNKLCEIRCPWYLDCIKFGYLSQFRLYQNKDELTLQVYTAQPPEATTDAELKETITAYGLDREGTVLVVDEADPIKMIPLRQINFDDWREAVAFYNNTPAGVFFELLLRETATVPNKVKGKPKKVIKQSNENGVAFRDAIGRVFDAFEQYLSQFDITLKQGLKEVQAIFDDVASWGLDRTNIDSGLEALYSGNSMKINAQIEALPYNHSSLIRDLQALLTSSTDSQTPPVRNIAQYTWEFAVPPTINAKKNIYLTASNTTPLIRTQLREVDVEITQTENLQAPWMPNNKLYQINTGRYTPRSLFKMEQKTVYKPNGEKIKVDDTATLKPRGKQILELIIATLQDGKGTLIVAPGALCEPELWNNAPIIKELHQLPNAHIATHQHAIGVNRYSELPRAFIFHYEPHILELIFVVKAIYPNETLDWTRERITLEKHGVILKDVWRYKDERVQQVYDAMCANPMMQSGNRIRPQLYKNKELWTLSAEPIQVPTTPILFSISDWKAWIDTDRADTFDVFLQTRTDRGVDKVAEQDNVSERTAYRRTEKTRSQSKAERDSEIIKLHEQGHKQSDIAMHCKVSEATVSRVIKAYTEQ